MILGRLVRRATRRQAGRQLQKLRLYLRLQVDKYLAASGLFPQLEPLKKKPDSIAPDVIDMGERKDRHTPRQRQRRDSNA